MSLWYNFWGRFRAGLYKQGIMHDWSKYSPVEFINSVRNFQGGKKSPNFGEKATKGYSSSWLHHKGRNRHHFEYWIDFTLNPDEGLQGMPMPTRYVLEMFCDRIAASKNYNRKNYDDSFPLAYYEKNKSHYILHKDTKELLERLLHMLADEGEDKTFAYIRKNIDWKHSPKW